jgi:hypothetical protein
MHDIFWRGKNLRGWLIAAWLPPVLRPKVAQRYLGSNSAQQRLSSV